MRPIVLAMLGALQAGLLTVTPACAADPLKVFSLPAILESAPLLVAVEKMPANQAVSVAGGIPNLWEGERVTFPGLADVAGNAETQALRF